MILSETERLDLSQRLNYLYDVGGKEEVARLSKVSRCTIFNLLKPGFRIKAPTYAKISIGLKKLEKRKKKLLATA